MPEHHLDTRPSGTADGGTGWIELPDLEAALPVSPSNIAAGASAQSEVERDELARDFAEIENATAALRKGEPALESWTTPAATLARPPRPLWILIAALWLSTAIVAVGALVAIVMFVG